MAAPEIFDRKARRLRRDRIALAPEAFLAGQMIDELIERLDGVNRTFEQALVIGAEPRLIESLRARGMTVTAADPSPRRAAQVGGIVAEEDHPIEGAGTYDLIIACGTLDTVSDLPGALVLLRRLLRPDGLFLAIFPGAPSLTSLRAAVAKADGDRQMAIARFHPQIDVPAAGDLLVRAGFALPVADRMELDLAYASVAPLLTDLRAAAFTNVLATRYPVTKSWLTSVDSAFAELASADGRTREQISFIVMTGWAPAPSQPQPARRGSATASLTEALKQRP